MPRPKNSLLADVPVTHQQYYRLVAEVRTIRAWVRELYVTAHSGGPDAAVSPEMRAEMENRIEKGFEETIAVTYSRLLEEIEDISPTIAAELDDRSDEEIH